MKRPGRIKRGFIILTKSYELILENKRLLLFPIFSLIANAILITGLLGSLLLLFMSLLRNPQAIQVLTGLKGGYAAIAVLSTLLLIYFACFFINSFFNAALIRCSYELLKGKRIRIKDGFISALSRVKLICIWSLVLATIAIVLSALRRKRRNLIAGIAGAAWHFISLFTLPILILEGVPVRKAMRKSVGIFRNKWGETFTGEFSIGSILALLITPLILCIFPLAQLSNFGATNLPIVLAVLVIYALFLIVCAATASCIYRTALYIYAVNGPVTGPFSKEEFEGAPNAEAGGRFIPLLFNFLIVGIVTSLLSSWVFLTARKAESWPTTEGRITVSRVTEKSGKKGPRYFPEVAFSYSVEGKDYAGTNIGILKTTSSYRLEVQRLVEKYPTGKRVTVHYNPLKPEKHFIELHVNVFTYAIFCLGIIFAAIGTSGCIVQRRHKLASVEKEMDALKG